MTTTSQPHLLSSYILLSSLSFPELLQGYKVILYHRVIGVYILGTETLISPQLMKRRAIFP
jgi:hypothetical protein